ncbi:MAG: carboxymuconolactone decarboxylase family protein, partial [Betaproteobacteria bacterium]|nr:carboxymuconolactone decarboxylase family protein [Betaproteobacteria bacterium]
AARTLPADELLIYTAAHAAIQHGALSPTALEDICRLCHFYQERLSWPTAKSAEEAALREQLIEKYGWHGVSTRIRTQSHQGYDSIKSYNRTDPQYLKLWFDFIYGELYTRGIVDDRTRLLVMVGICLAVNEPIQLENHMRGALLFGATPREVMEVIVHSTAYVGMPTTILTGRMLERIAKEENRLAELIQ